MFNRILVPLDGSPLAEVVLPHVVTIASANSPLVQLIRVLEPPELETSVRPADPLDWQIMRAEADSYIQSVASRMEDAGCRVSAQVVEGKPADSILSWIQDRQIDFVMMSTHGRSGISGWNISSVVQKVILRARISFEIVRAYQPAPENLSGLRYRRILLPLDGSARAESVLGIAEALARAEKGHLEVVHIVRQPEMPRNTPLSQEDQDLMNQFVGRNQKEAEKYLSNLKNRLGVEIETKLQVSKSVHEALHQIEDSEKIDLVIVSAHGYTGSLEWPYGNVVVSLIAYGTKPLMVVQDLPKEAIHPSAAEQAAQQVGGH